MKEIEDKKSEINLICKDALTLTYDLKHTYRKLFDFNNCFSTQNAGKTRINRKFYVDSTSEINKQLSLLSTTCIPINHIINQTLDLLLIQIEFKSEKEFQLDHLFIKMIEKKIELLNKSTFVKKELFSSIQEFISLKNQFLNIGYFIERLNTFKVENYLNHLIPEELIVNKVILDFMNLLTFQLNEINKLEYTLEHFNNNTYKPTKIRNINSLINYFSNTMTIYKYHENNYHFNIVFYNKLKEEEFNCNSFILENILSYLIEQSCIDMLNKVLQNDKSSKVLEVELLRKKNSIIFTFTNNGHHIDNLEKLIENDNQVSHKDITQIQNLAYEINGNLSITILENETNLYTLEINI